MNFFNFSLSLSLLSCCAIQSTRALTGIEEIEAGNRLTLPATTTSQTVHGICVTGAISAHAASDLSTLTYTEVMPFLDGSIAWDDRDYTIDGITYSPCAGGIYLRPSVVKSIASGTVIDITTVPDGSRDTKVCVFVVGSSDGGWPSTLVRMGFVEYTHPNFKYNNATAMRSFCQVQRKQKRCDELYVLEGFDLGTDIIPTRDTIIMASYDLDGSFPFKTGVYSILHISYDSLCFSVKENRAPKCDVEVEIKFCKTINCESTTMSGKFLASGTGPKPYIITGGTNDLFNAGGTIDSELDQTDLTLRNVKVNLCFNNKA